MKIIALEEHYGLPVIYEAAQSLLFLRNRRCWHRNG
jgi:hypothetical protein